MDALVTQVRDQVMIQLRPLIATTMRPGRLNVASLNNLEREARRLTLAASGGAVEMVRLNLIEPGCQIEMVLRRVSEGSGS